MRYSKRAICLLKKGEKNEKISQGHLMVFAEENNITFKPHESKSCTFGDDDGTLIGRVYDYMLRGEDKGLRKQNQLSDQLCEATDPDKIKKIGKEWMESLSDHEEDLTGVDSPSFKVRFHEWNR